MFLRKSEKGQSFLEYSLIIAVFILVIASTLPGLRNSVNSVFIKVSNSLSGTVTTNTVDPLPTTPPLTPLGTTLPEISGSMIDRINAYYLANGRYPSSTVETALTQLGLSKDYWKDKSYNGIVYQPSGSSLGLYPGSGYVFNITDVNGTKIQFDESSWGLIYSIPNSNTWHYRKANGTVVDITTLEVTKK
jgi:Flp pilus assembly pilin Flp